MSRDSIISKIRKLIELSNNNPSKEEAISAALKAQKLMADYDIEASELHEGEIELVITEIPTGPIGKTTYFITLATVIAKNFRCKVYRSGRAGHYVANFYGYEADAEAAKTTFEYLYDVSDRMANRECVRYRKEFGTGAGVYNAFAHGFLEGVQAELEKQCQALMLVTPKAVEDGWAELSSKFDSCKGMRYRNIRGAHESGRQAAQDSIRSHRLDGQKALED